MSGGSPCSQSQVCLLASWPNWYGCKIWSALRQRVLMIGCFIIAAGGFDFRPEDKELYKAFNEELIKFKKTDAYAKILTNYGLSQESVDAARSKKMEDLCAGK